MKKLFLFLFIAINVNALSQVERGSWMIGSTIELGGNFLNGRIEFGSSNAAINLNPNVAYFIDDNIGIGSKCLIGFSNIDGVHTLHFGLTPALRYYFMGINSSRVFIQATGGVQGTMRYSKVKLQSSFTGGLGLNYWINKNLAFEAEADFYYNQSDFLKGTVKSGISLNVGVQIFFPRKGRTTTKSLYRQTRY